MAKLPSTVFSLLLSLGTAYAQNAEVQPERPSITILVLIVLAFCLTIGWMFTVGWITWKRKRGAREAAKKELGKSDHHALKN